MKALTKDQYYNLKNNYVDAITLAKQSMLANGVDDLIPMYEDITGQVMNRNCSDCRLDMMILLYVACNNYERLQPTETPIEKTKSKK